MGTGPIGSQVYQKVQATMRLHSFVPVEVGVDAQMATLAGQVNAATDHIRIRQQVFDASQGSEKLEEWPRIQIVQRGSQYCREALFLRATHLDLEVFGAVIIPTDVVFRLRKAGAQFSCTFGLEELIEDRVRIGRGRSISLLVLCAKHPKVIKIEDVRHAMRHRGLGRCIIAVDF